jgi:hypothetical protein
MTFFAPSVNESWGSADLAVGCHGIRAAFRKCAAVAAVAMASATRPRAAGPVSKAAGALDLALKIEFG